MKERTCKNCGFCRQIYRRSWYRFSETPHYYCQEREEMLSPREGCEKWKVRKTVRDLTRARFLKAEEDLLYLLEKCKDEKPDPTAK